MYRYQRSHCRHCGCTNLFRKRRVDHGAHAAASLFTFGLWLVGWLAVAIQSARKPWRCARCGARRPEEAPVSLGARVPETCA